MKSKLLILSLILILSLNLGFKSHRTGDVHGDFINDSNTSLKTAPRVGASLVCFYYDSTYSRLAQQESLDNIKKEKTREANAIKIYVNDSTAEQAKNRFIEYINQTWFQVNNQKTEKAKPEPLNQKDDYLQLNNLNREAETILNKYTPGDTLTTALATLYDTMMGQYSAWLKFYISKDKGGELYITITGYVSSNAFGIDFYGLKMQKGGKDANWAQRNLFKNLNKYLLKYEGVKNIVYLSE